MMVKAALRIEHTRHTKSPRVVLNASPLTDDPATEESPSATGTGSLGATARPALPCAASALFAGTFPGSSRSIPVEELHVHVRARWERKGAVRSWVRDGFSAFY